MGVMVISNRVSALLKGPRRSAWELPRRVGGERGQAFSPAGLRGQLPGWRGPLVKLLVRRPGGSAGGRLNAAAPARSGPAPRTAGRACSPGQPWCPARAIAAPVPRPARQAGASPWMIQGAPGSLVIATAVPPLAGSGFAEAAGSVPDARCRAPGGARRAPRAPAEVRGRGGREAARPGPWARAGAARDGRRASSLMRRRCPAPAGFALDPLGRLGLRCCQGSEGAGGAVPLVQHRWGCRLLSFKIATDIEAGDTLGSHI